MAYHKKKDGGINDLKRTNKQKSPNCTMKKQVYHCHCILDRTKGTYMCDDILGRKET